MDQTMFARAQLIMEFLKITAFREEDSHLLTDEVYNRRERLMVELERICIPGKIKTMQ